MGNSATATPTFQAQNSNILNDGSADSPRGWAISTNADYTFTATGPSRARCTATSANRSVNLPTTGIKAGYEAEVVTACTSPYTITVKSSNGNTVDTMKGTKGRIRCVALIDTPLASGDWEVVQVEDAGSYLMTISSAGGGSATYFNNTALFTRINRTCTIIFWIRINTNSLGAGQLRVNLPYANTASRSSTCLRAQSLATGAAPVLMWADNTETSAVLVTQSTTTTTEIATGSLQNASELGGTFVYQI